MTIKTRLLLAFATMLLIIVGQGIYAMRQSEKIGEMMVSVYDNNLVPIRDVSDVNMQALYHIRAVLRMMVEPTAEGRTEAKDIMRQRAEKYDQLMTKYQGVVLSDAEKSALQALKPAWEQYLQLSAQIVQLVEQGKTAEAMAFYGQQVRPAFDKADNLLSEIVDVNVKLAADANTDGKATVSGITTLTMVLIVLAVIFTVAVALIISGSINSVIAKLKESLARLAAGDLSILEQPQGKDEITEMQVALRQAQDSLISIVQVLKKNAQTLDLAAGELVSAAQQVTVSSEHQSESTADSAASVEQLTTSVSHVSDKAGEANQLAIRSGKLAESGRDAVSRAGAEVEEVSVVIANAAQRIGHLSGDIQRIGQISVVIKDVADQTNLLALNAAIEAARAGEMGRGFAVVADEVRKLAERTTTATQEIAGMISAIQSGSSEAADAMLGCTSIIDKVKTTTGSASQIMNQVGGEAGQVQNVMTEISYALNEQAIASQNIAKTVEALAQMSEENVAAAMSVSQTAESLRGLSGDINQSIAFFRT